MTGLGAPQRAALERLIVRARSILEQDLLAQAAGRYGVNVDGTIEEENALRLDPSALADRREIVAIVQHLRDEGETPTGAIARLIREAAFTHLNRFVAIRVAEAMALLPPSLAEGRASRGFREVVEVAPLLGGDETGGYWTYLRLCGDEMASDAPVLFDPRNPLLTLSPGVAALDDLVTLFSDPAAREIWTASDAFGWAYQFFNTGDERRQMRDESAAPRNSRELAVRNQFFTPRYVVDFLVQNTLGRRLLEAQLNSALIDALPLLVDPPTEPGEPLALDEVRILDPACGSGHFLIGCYDLLERAWQLQGVEPGDAAPLILPTLWGIDIDPRCAQVASAAIVFRARRHCRHLPLPRPNVITARALPDGSDWWEQVLASLPSDRRDLVQSMREALAQAPLLGPLLRVEEQLEAEIRRHFTGSNIGEGTLAEGIASDAFGEVESEVLAALQRAADSASSSAAERLLAAEAGDAIRFVEAMRLRYDVVLLNPPYGEPVPESVFYLRREYRDWWTELYACFADRAAELLRVGGVSGALTSSQYFTTRKMKPFREHLISHRRPLAIVDLGPGVLHGATVNTAVIVSPLGRGTGTTYYADLSRTPLSQRESLLYEAARNGLASIDLSVFLTIDRSPLAMHMPLSVLAKWEETARRLQPAVATVATGNNTFDNFRFLRCHWELTVVDKQTGWLPYQKGGTYQPYFAPAHLYIDLRDDAKELKAIAMERVGTTAQAMQSSRWWGEPGLTYPRVSSVGFGVRCLPPGEVFGDKGICIFPKEGVDRIALLSLLNTTPVAEILQTFGRGRDTHNGAVKSLPIGPEELDQMRSARGAIEGLIQIFARIEARRETSAWFVSPFALGGPTTAPHALKQREELLHRAEELQAEVDDAGRAVFLLRERIDPSLEARTTLLRRAWELTSRDWAIDVLSYFVGVAFGRWKLAGPDVDDAPHLRDPWAPLPVSPPGSEAISDAHGVLHIEGAGDECLPWLMRAAADELELEGGDVIDAALREVGAASLEEFLIKGFFREHLKRYSMSQRAAPVYWPLAVPSRSWGIWIYFGKLTRETLFAVARAARTKEEALQHSLRVMAQNIEREGRESRSRAKERSDQETLLDELSVFKKEAERVAQAGWEPQLSDGSVLCAAALADLFPAWRELTDFREEIRRGSYPWATVSRWKEVL